MKNKLENTITVKLILFIILFMTFLINFNHPVNIEAAENIGKDYINFTILHTNDEHSALLPQSSLLDYGQGAQDSSVGGAARLAGAIKSIKKEKEVQGESVVTVSAGDFLGGTPFSWLSYKDLAPELNTLQKIGYDLITIGNHDFDYGTDGLVRYLKAAGYPAAREKLPIVASNILPEDGHALASMGLFDTYIMRLDEGLKIGFMGLLGNEAALISPRAHSINFVNPQKAARQKTKLLQEKGADIIIALSHSGIEEDKKLAAAVNGLDIIISGHSHEALYLPLIENNTIIVQADSSLKYLGILELRYIKSTHDLIIRNKNTGTPFLLPLSNKISPDPEITDYLNKYVQEINQIISEITGGRFSSIEEAAVKSSFMVTKKPQSLESPAGNLLTDAFRLITSERMGKNVDFALQFSDLIRSSIYPGSSKAVLHKISLYDLILPGGYGGGFDEYAAVPSLSSYYLKGEDVHKLLEISAFIPNVAGKEYFFNFSGLRYRYKPHRTILFKIPFIDFPIPSIRSVTAVEKYSGSGVQTEDNDYYYGVNDDGKLYHVVSSYYLLNFIDIIKDYVPVLNMKIRRKDGSPVNNLKNTIIKTNGRELKLFEVLLDYVSTFDKRENDIEEDRTPWIPEYYASTTDRVIEERGDSDFAAGFTSLDFINKKQKFSSEINIEIDNITGFYAGFRHELLYRIFADLFIEIYEDSNPDYNCNLQGINSSISYEIGHFKDLDFYLKSGLGYYSGNYYTTDPNSTSYDIEDALSGDIGVSLKQSRGIFTLYSEITYRYFSPDFVGDRKKSLDLSGLNFKAGVNYRFNF